MPPSRTGASSWGKTGSRFVFLFPWYASMAMSWEMHFLQKNLVEHVLCMHQGHCSAVLVQAHLKDALWRRTSFSTPDAHELWNQWFLLDCNDQGCSPCQCWHWYPGVPIVICTRCTLLKVQCGIDILVIRSIFPSADRLQYWSQSRLQSGQGKLFLGSCKPESVDAGPR